VGETPLTPADGHSFEDETAGLLLESAFDLLAKGGWGNFSLRAVADSIGAAGSAASHRFGDRAGLVTAVCDTAVMRERVQMQQFLPGVEVDTGDELAAILCEWLEQRVRWNRKQARACSELLLVSYRDPYFGAFGGQWTGACREMIARLYPAASEDGVRAMAAFLSVEIASWLLLADDPQFRLASGEALRRVALLGGGKGGALPVFWLGRGLKTVDAAKPMDLTGTKQKIVEATAHIILESGVQALTHREIAKRSGASLSSLTYHFESLNDLIRSGLRLIFSPGQPAPAAPGRALVGYELTLQALRDPFLAPLAATVRRRLGQGLFDDARPGDIQAMARREARAMLETAFLLSGDEIGSSRWLKD